MSLKMALLAVLLVLPAAGSANSAAGAEEASMNKPHVRRERQAIFHSPKHAAQMMHRMHPGQMAQMLLQEDPVVSPTATHDTVSTDEEIQPSAPVVNGDDLATDEAIIGKLDADVSAAEEKAGLDLHTQSTPEPQRDGPSDEDEEVNALVIAMISLVVLIGACAAGWSIYVAMKMRENGKKATELLGENAEGEAGEEDAAVDAGEAVEAS